MKIDVVTIFPDYLAPLQISLLGKAQDQGIVDIHVHDLRSKAIDNHHAVDDTPYGGGAGMVMLPEIWGQALDPLMSQDCDLIILTPAGKRFDQPMAEKFSQAQHLIFACGRYEGIDDRVRIHYEKNNYRVHEVSIGDYVLGGGEAAALVMIEAITRLIPGVLGNPQSLAQ
jgi:tRNA (guanine37-N1)-methyltransferase